MLGIPIIAYKNIRMVEGYQKDIKNRWWSQGEHWEAHLEINDILYKKQPEEFRNYGNWLTTYE